MGDNQALREQIAQAIHDWRCIPECLGYEHHGGPSKDFYRDEADAVLPVVQAHEKDLADEVQEYRSAICWDTTCFNCSKLLDRCYADTQRAETAEEALSSLLDAVARLAAELDEEANRRLRAKEAAVGEAWRAGLNDSAVAFRKSAPSRSLLPQEGQR